MASNINSTDIDAEYPVAGQDNDSQGFRDNFSTIKNSLATAKSEITQLQGNTAQGVTYDSDTNTNDFNGNKIQEADFIATTETVYPGIEITASQNISFRNGHYQIIQVGADITLTLADWPATKKAAKLRLQITSDGSPRTITWAASGGGSFRAPNGDTNTLIVPGNTGSSGTAYPLFVDFWTVDGGNTVFRKTSEQYFPNGVTPA